MTPLHISILVAMAKNRVIGRSNRLPWHLPADLKHFKFLTMGQNIVMGRKTYESIGKPLPGRTNVIITRQTDYKVPGAMVAHSLEDALMICTGHSENFIIGGEKIYRQALNKCQRMYITEIQRDFVGDTFFPEFDRNEWEETQRDRYIAENEDNLEYHFVVLERRSSTA